MSGRPIRILSTPVLRVVVLLLSLVTLVVGLSGSPASARKHRPRSGTVAPTTAGRFGAVPTLPRIVPTTAAKAPAVSTVQPRTTAATKADPKLRRIGFRTTQKLQDHFAKHGREFGDITIDRYLAMAQDLRDAPLSSQVLEAHQVGGTISRFDRRSGAFIAFDTDLTIRTFFKPNDGEAYFRRAAQTSH